MKVVGEFELKGEDPKVTEAKEFLATVLSGLKGKIGKGFKLDLDVKSKEEAAEKVKFLMKVARKRKGDFRKLLIRVKDAGANGFEVEALIKARSHKKPNSSKQAKEAKKAANEENNKKIAESAKGAQDKQMENWLHQKDVLEHPEKFPDEHRALEQSLKVQGKSKEQMLTIINAAIKMSGGQADNGLRE